jgi:DNA-binding NarL/FixJ family response regulator
MIGVAASASAVRRLDDLITAAEDRLGAKEVIVLVGQGRALSPQHALALVTAAGPARSADGTARPPAAGADRTTPAGRLGPAGPGPLTEREAEVAVLVARGLSNRAIGTKLFITQATAARHVANIFLKLGFTSRSQIAAWVITSAPGESG